MQRDSLEEYTLIRKELESLKTCITTYVGFVLGGASVALLLIGRGVMDAKGAGALVPFGYTALALSLVVSSVFSILLYKFNSHNRYAGYCKLLTQEHLEIVGGTPPGPIVGWEVCMDQLRKSDLGLVDLATIQARTSIRGIDLPRIQTEIRDRSGGKARTNKRSAWKGLCIFIRLLLGRGVTSDSWHFPAYIAGAFLMLTILFLISAGLLLGLASDGPKSLTALLAFTVIAAYQVFTWIVYATKLGRLLAGGATVESYCWRFVLVRLAVVEAHLGERLESYRIIVAQ